MVSVIITTKDRLELFKRALDSVKNQTYTNIEIIVLDNSLGDETKKFCLENKEIYNIKYFEIKNTNNISEIRNIGVQNANGEYIAFLDDDDLWEKDKLTKQVEKFVTNKNLGVVYTLTKEIKIYNDYELYSFPREFNTRNILIYNYVGNTSNPLIRKSCFIDVGGFDENTVNCEEYELWIRLLEKYETDIVKEPLSIYTNLYKDTNKLSLNICEYIKGYEYLTNKHKTKINNLNKKEIKLRDYCFYMNVYSKYLITCDRKNARIYLKKAIKSKFLVIDLMKYLLTFMSLNTNIKFKVFYHSILNKFGGK